MKKILSGFLCLSLSSLIANTALAQGELTASIAKPVVVSTEEKIVTAGEAKAAAEEEKPEDKGKFTYSGYFDTYYFANLNSPSSRNNLGASGVSRGFDRYAGQFQLGSKMPMVAKRA